MSIIIINRKMNLFDFFSKSFLILFSLFLFHFILIAQHPNWMQISNQGSITSIASDGDSLWMTTQGYGIILFEKKSGQISYFNNVNSGLPHNESYYIFIDPEHNKWIQTKLGLVLYDDKTWELLDSSDSEFPKFKVIDAVCNDSGAIWFVGYSNVEKYFNNKWYSYNESNTNNIFKKTKTTLGIEKSRLQDKIYILQSNQIIEYNAKLNNWLIKNYENTELPKKSNFLDFTIDSLDNFQLYQSDYVCELSRYGSYDSMNIKEYFDEYTWFNDIQCDKKNKIWFASNRGAYCIWINFYHYIDEFQTSESFFCPWANVECIHVDNNNNKWFGYSSDTVDLFRFDDNLWYKYNLSNFPYQINNPSDIIQLDNGNILILTYYGGIFIFNGINWSNIELPKKYSSYYFYKVLQLNNGELIFATSNGILSYKEPTWSIVDSTDKFIYGFQIIDQDRYGNFWAAGYHEIYYITKNTCEVKYKISDSLFVRDLKVDKLNRLWVTTQNQIIQYENGKWSKIDNKNEKLRDISFTTINVDSLNTIYFGTYPDGKLVIYNGSDFIVNNTFQGICGSMSQIKFDNYGDCWLCTNNGVIKVSENNIESLNPYNSGLTDENVEKMLIDQNQNKWFISPHGISIYNETGNINFNYNKSKKSSACLIIYPNPSNSLVTLEATVPQKANVILSLYDLKGNLLKNIENSELIPGTYFYILNTSTIPNGYYFVNMVTENVTLTEKLIKIK
ncbi:MAG: T9SS type A sorting domain-containing protein [bacterium]